MRTYDAVAAAGVLDFAGEEITLKWMPLPRGGMGSEGAVSPVYQGVADKWLMGALRSVGRL